MTTETATAAAIAPVGGFQYYDEQTTYWNDFEAVLDYIATAVSGRQKLWWRDHLMQSYGPFDSAFFLNCGNGWVEREFFQAGVIQRAICTDISEPMLADAAKAAAAIGFPVEYLLQDCNTLSSDKIKVDLVVNHAAMHHVAYIDHVTRELAKMLKTGGYYVGFDYVGHHRNQYPYEVWSKVLEFSERLPSQYRLQSGYPHLKTMLATDPTEAIHSELQVQVMGRYFDILEYSNIGGAIAYQLLFNNKALFRDRHTPEGSLIVQKILDYDRAFCDAHPEHNLFAFWIARPKSQWPSPAQLSQWTLEEVERETKAKNNGGRYYPVTALELIYNEMADVKDALKLVAK